MTRKVRLLNSNEGLAPVAGSEAVHLVEIGTADQAARSGDAAAMRTAADGAVGATGSAPEAGGWAALECAAAAYRAFSTIQAYGNKWA